MTSLGIDGSLPASLTLNQAQITEGNRFTYESEEFSELLTQAYKAQLKELHNPRSYERRVFKLAFNLQKREIYRYRSDDGGSKLCPQKIPEKLCEFLKSIQTDPDQWKIAARSIIEFTLRNNPYIFWGQKYESAEFTLILAQTYYTDKELHNPPKMERRATQVDFDLERETVCSISSDNHMHDSTAQKEQRHSFKSVPLKYPESELGEHSFGKLILLIKRALKAPCFTELLTRAFKEYSKLPEDAQLFTTRFRYKKIKRNEASEKLPSDVSRKLPGQVDVRGIGNVLENRLATVLNPDWRSVWSSQKVKKKFAREVHLLVRVQFQFYNMRSIQMSLEPYDVGLEASEKKAEAERVEAERISLVEKRAEAERMSLEEEKKQEVFKGKNVDPKEKRITDAEATILANELADPLAAELDARVTKKFSRYRMV